MAPCLCTPRGALSLMAGKRKAEFHKSPCVNFGLVKSSHGPVVPQTDCCSIVIMAVYIAGSHVPVKTTLRRRGSRSLRQLLDLNSPVYAKLPKGGVF